MYKRSTKTVASKRQYAPKTTYIPRQVITKRDIENKYCYYSTASTADYNGAVLDISPVTQGTTSEQYVGSRLRWQRLEYNIRCRISATNGDILRFVFFRYKVKSSASAPASGDIFKEATGIDYLSALSTYDNKVVGDEAIILKDLKVQLSSTGESTRILSGTVNLRDVICEMDSSGYGTNKLFLQVMGQSVNVNGYQVSTRITFKDY